MTPDVQILSIVQIALIGILVVIGMFFLWRKIQRLEQKVEALTGQMEHCVGGCPYPPAADKQEPNSYVGFVSAAPRDPSSPVAYPDAYPDAEEDDDEDYDDGDDIFTLNAAEEAIVQRMFQDGGNMQNDDASAAAFMVFTPFGFKPAAPAPTTAPQVEIEEYVETSATDADAATEVESESRPATKTKLSKMNVEQLKSYLSQRHLSTEGTKKQLFERAVETITATL